MEKIKWVEIENFRTFSKLKVDGLGDVNIIVGKNNTGKSTFLEALFLSISHHIAPSILRGTLRTLFEKRGVSLSLPLFPYNDMKYEDLKSFIETFFFYEISEASITTSLGKFKIEKQSNLEIPFSDFVKNLEDKYVKRILRRFKITSEVLLSSFIEEKIVIGNLAEILFLTLEERKKRELLQDLLLDIPLQAPRKIFMLNYEKDFVQIKGSSFKKYKFMVDNSLLCLKFFAKSSVWEDLIRNLERFLSPDLYLNLKSSISPFFGSKVKSIYPSFSDVYIETETEKVPFSLVGDGIKNLALNVISLNLDKPTYVFLEEPETFLHPKMMDVLSMEIVRSGRRNQIFLTTHSLEFVENLLYYAKKSEEIDVKVIGFYDLADGKLDYEIYGKEQAYTIVNRLGEDIR